MVDEPGFRQELVRDAVIVLLSVLYDLDVFEGFSPIKLTLNMEQYSPPDADNNSNNELG